MSNEIGDILDGKITSITKFGAFVLLPDSKSGMIHISEVSDSFVKDIGDFLKVGQNVRVKVCAIDDKGRISLSLKQVTETRIGEKRENVTQHSTRIVPEPIEPKSDVSSNFEDMMSRYMKASNEKISDLKKSMDAKRSSPGFSRKYSKKY